MELANVKVEVTIDFTGQKVSDLLVTAFEGGSNYWYWIENYTYPEGQTKESLGIEFLHAELPLIEGGSLLIKDIEGDMEDKILDLEAIKKGIKIMSEKYKRHFSDWLDDSEDAITADVFLQCCLYGEVVFG